MADRNGYIGRAPADSAVQVARQTFSPTGVTTDFTFSSGYVPGYFDIYINGVKMIEGSDYTSTDGSTFSVLNGGATNGDVIEGVAYKAFNAATVTNASTLTVSGDLTVNGTTTFSGAVAAGTSVSFATTAFALEGTPDVAVRNLTGVAATFTGDVSAVDGTFTGDVSVRNLTGVAATFTGVVTYEDVTNIDSVGIVTAQGGLNVVGGGATVTGVSTFFDTVRVGSAITLGASSGIITATKFVGSGEGLTGVASTDNIITSTASTFANINSTGIVTAVSFSGDGSGLSGVGGQLDVTSSLFI